jgi:hypothetical protein
MQSLKNLLLSSGTSDTWILAFGLGALIGLVAKVRGAWL